MSTQPNLLELAKQGNAQAIATLLSRSLQPKGITAKVNLKDSCLHVILEAVKAPDQQTLMPFLQKGLKSLASPAFKKVNVYGKITSENFPAWTSSFELNESFPGKLDAIQSDQSYPTTQQTQSGEHLEAVLIDQRNSGAPSKPVAASSKKFIDAPHKLKVHTQPTKTQSKDYGYELLGFLSEKLESWTLRKRAYTLLAVGGFLLVVALPSCSSSASLGIGIWMFFIALVSLILGFHCLRVDNRQKSEKTVSNIVKEAIKEFKQKSPSVDVVKPNNFQQVDNLSFSVVGVSYENKIIAYHEKEHLGSVAVGDDNWAAAIPLANTKPVHIDITGKGVVVEMVVHNNQKLNDTLSDQIFYLMDQHFNCYSMHPLSVRVSAVRKGITEESNLRPGMKAKYFATFDVNPESVALMLIAKYKEEQVVFSLDLEQKLVI